MNYTEDTLVQQAIANYLQQLGWRSVLAWNNEDFMLEGTISFQLDRMKLSISRHEAKRPQ